MVYFRNLFLLVAIAICTLTVLNGCTETTGEVKPQAFDEKIVLFDGTDFSQWIHHDNKKIEWKIVDGAMEIAPETGSIMTRQNFRDFKLHLEFNVPETPHDTKHQGRGNSGVYIQRRYEVQILDSLGLESKHNDYGAIYKVKAPDENVCKKPGQWQTYDITFRAPKFKKQDGSFVKIKNARITVLHNDVLIHDDVKIPNKTGAGKAEGPEPGPILLQDHGHKVKFRNIWIIPLS